MNGPLGRQGPAATFRQNCPQMTRRRCNNLFMSQCFLQLIIAPPLCGCHVLKLQEKNIPSSSILRPLPSSIPLILFLRLKSSSAAVPSQIFSPPSLSPAAAYSNSIIVRSAVQRPVRLGLNVHQFRKSPLFCSPPPVS